MKARFIGDGATEVCEVFGLSFPVGQWVAVPASAYRKLATNPMFDADQDDDGGPDLSLDEMRAMLAERGVKVHHKAGFAKLAALIAETA